MGNFIEPVVDEYKPVDTLFSNFEEIPIELKSGYPKSVGHYLDKLFGDVEGPFLRIKIHRKNGENLMLSHVIKIFRDKCPSRDCRDNGGCVKNYHGTTFQVCGGGYLDENANFMFTTGIANKFGAVKEIIEYVLYYNVDNK